MVQLDRGRGTSTRLRRAATIDLPESLIRPSFDEPNISNPSELKAVLTELATSSALEAGRDSKVRIKLRLVASGRATDHRFC